MVCGSCGIKAESEFLYQQGSKNDCQNARAGMGPGIRRDLPICRQGGGPPRGNKEGIEHTSMVKQIEQNWDSKLWWPHSEALYTTMLLYKLTGDPELLAQYNRLHDYTFKTFPNPDRSVGEWIQIRSRSGKPINQVVALPVKDPYHIIRNVILIIELLATNEVKTE